MLQRNVCCLNLLLNMEFTEAGLNKYTKPQLIEMLLEREALTKLISDLREEIHTLSEGMKRLESDVIVGKHVNEELKKQLVKTERQCWANAQYSRRECLEISGIPSTITDTNLEGKVLEVTS